MRPLIAVWLLLSTCALAFAHSYFAVAPARAARHATVVVPTHGAAQWIQDGRYRNAIGDLCCGEHDCSELAANDVAVTPSGYLIKSLNETVPYQEATPSPDGHYWRCYWGGKRKCFFAPPTST